MRKKLVKLLIFNGIIIALAALCLSKRGLNLTFNPLENALKFAFSLGLSFLIIAIFIAGNYIILSSKERVEIKVGKLSTIDECIDTLRKCQKTDPAFLVEIKKAISQLESLQRKKDSLKQLLEINGISESFEYLNDTADKADLSVISNTKSIINRLIVFDNDEYVESEDSYDITSHKEYIRGLLEENQKVLDEYSNMLEAISKVNDQDINLNEIQTMTQALRNIIKGKTFSSPNNLVEKENEHDE